MDQVLKIYQETWESRVSNIESIPIDYNIHQLLCSLLRYNSVDALRVELPGSGQSALEYMEENPHNWNLPIELNDNNQEKSLDGVTTPENIRIKCLELKRKPKKEYVKTNLFQEKKTSALSVFPLYINKLCKVEKYELLSNDEMLICDVMKKTLNISSEEAEKIANYYGNKITDCLIAMEDKY